MSENADVGCVSSNRFESLGGDGVTSAQPAVINDTSSSSFDVDYLRSLLHSALGSVDKSAWMRVLAYAKDDVISVAKCEPNLVSARSVLFRQLQSMFPDLGTATLVSRRKNSAAVTAADMYILAKSLVENEYLPELADCILVNSRIMESIVNLRKSVVALEVIVKGVKAEADAAKSAVAVEPSSGENALVTSYRDVVLTKPTSTNVVSLPIAVDDSDSVNSCAQPATRKLVTQTGAIGLAPVGPLSRVASTNQNASNENLAVAGSAVGNLAGCVKDDEFQKVTIRRNGGKRKSFVFFYNINKTCTSEDLEMRLQGAGFLVRSIEKFARHNADKCSFKVGLPEDHAHGLLQRVDSSFLPQSCKLRLWSKDKPVRGTKSLPHSNNRTSEQLMDGVSSGLVTVITEFLAKIRACSHDAPRPEGRNGSH